MHTDHEKRVAINDIKSKVPDAKIEFIEMDLTSFESVKKAADEFLRFVITPIIPMLYMS